MPLILAHRGANKAAPQNTIPAFKKAVEFAADGIETDVHLSKDGEIVICHNYTVDDTSNGKGLIDDMTFAELRRLDFGSYFSKDFKGVTLPTLAELIEVVKNMTLINIEIKAPKKKNDLLKRALLRKFINSVSQEIQLFPALTRSLFISQRKLTQP